MTDTGDKIRTLSRTIYSGMKAMRSSFPLLVSLLAPLYAISAQPEEAGNHKSVIKAELDTLNEATDLQEFVIEEVSKKPLRAISPGAISLNTSALSHTIRNFGEADALGYIKLLPGISQNSDYSSGISIQGTDFSNTLYTIDSAPVFFPYHFGGVFSTFNTSHLNEVVFEKSIHSASMPNRLGGRIDTRHRFRKRGSVNVGMTASGLAFDLPVTSRLSLAAAARISYFNLLYSGPISTEFTTTKYGFHDLNLSAQYSVDACNKIVFEGFYNADKLRFEDSHYLLDTHLRWSNRCGAITWSRQGKWDVQNTLSYSGLSNGLELDMPDMTIEAPSSINQFSLKGETRTSLSKRIKRLDVGYAVDYTLIKPQNIKASGNITDNYTQTFSQSAWESRIYSDIEINLATDLTLGTGLKTTLFACGSTIFPAIDPHATLHWENDAFRMSFHVGSYHQFLHQVGLSDIGLASDFWISSSSSIKPSKSYSSVLSAAIPIFNNMFELSAEAYFRIIKDAPEYQGYVFNLLTSDYDVNKQIISGSGYNTGAEIMLRKDRGKLLGWLSYSYGIAKRKYPDTGNRYINARTSPGHAFNLFLDYHITSHWNFGGTFRLQSGRIITPVKALYLIAENVIMETGRRNSARMPLYHRLDLFATYHFNTGGKFPLKHYASLSILNAYAHKNMEIITYTYNPENNSLRIKEVGSLYRILPSLSYTIEF